MSRGCRHLKTQLGLENHLPALWAGLSSPPRGLSIELLRTRQPSSPQERDQGQRERESLTEDPVFHNLIPAMTCHHFCYMLLATQTTLVPCGRGPHKGVNARGRDLWGLLRGWLAREGTEHNEVHRWRYLDHNHMPLERSVNLTLPQVSLTENEGSRVARDPRCP